MEINQTSTGISSQIGSSSITQNFSNASPAKVAEEIGGLLAIFDPNNTNTLEKTPKDYEQILKTYKFKLIPGFFNFYKNSTQTLMEINSDQLGEENVFMLSAYRITGYPEKLKDLRPDEMMGNYRVYFKQEGTNIHLYKKNTDSRSNDPALAKAIARSQNDIKLFSAPISMICDEKILFDANDLLITKIEEQNSRIKLNDVNIDHINSSLGNLKNTLNSSLIEVSIDYIPKDEQNIMTAEQEERKNKQSDSTKTVSYAYNFSKLKKTNDYCPRLADKRIGHFTTPFNDYDKDKTGREVEYITRWNLGEIDPKTGKPERPIKFKVAKTVTKEYKEAVKNGILAWNKAFEKIGIYGAVEAEESGINDDPADIECNAVNFVVGGIGKSIGPDQVDPYTGEIYASDIIIDYDMIENEKNKIRFFDKNYAELTNEGDKQAYITKCLQKYVTELTFHEIGHGLGLMHNFKGSLKITNGVSASIMDYHPSLDGNYQTEPGEYDIEAIRYAYAKTAQLGKNNLKNTMAEIAKMEKDIEDINVKNSKTKENELKNIKAKIAGKKNELEKIKAKIAEEEKPELERIITNMYAKKIPYGTDADKPFDPTCATWDSGYKLLEYPRELVQRADGLLKRMKKDFQFEDYKPVLDSVEEKLKQALILASNYLGGIYIHRENMVKNPVELKNEPVPGSEQKEALTFILNELLPVFESNINPDNEKNLTNLESPFIIVSAKGETETSQSRVFDTIFSYRNLTFITLNQTWYKNEETYKNGSFKKSDSFTLSDLFGKTTSFIFAELEEKQIKSLMIARLENNVAKLKDPENKENKEIDSFSISEARRNIQETYINKLIQLSLSKCINTNDNDKEMKAPAEAVTLAKQTLSDIQKNIQSVLDKKTKKEIDINEKTLEFLNKILEKIPKRCL